MIVGEKSFGGNIGIKRKETRQGWMDGWMLPW